MTTIALAYPAIGGGRGLFRGQDVKSEGQGMLSLSLHNLITRYQDWYQLGLNGGVTYAPLSWIEFYISPTYSIWSRNFNFDTTHTGFYDTQTGLKFSFIGIPVFKLGAMGSLTIPTLDSRFGITADTARSLSYSVGGLIALDFSDVSKAAPFNIIINGGYRLGTYDSLLLRLGIELPAKTYAAILEVSTEQSGDSIFNFKSNPFRFTPGIKFTFPFGVGIDLGLDIALFSKVIPQFQGVLGLSFVSPFLKPGPVPIGTISGSIRDAVSSRPISAQVVFPGSDLAPIQVGEDGVLKADSVPVGIVSVQIIKTGYAEQTVPLVVKKNEITSYEFTLQPLHLYGILSGTVRDSKTSRPLRAKVSLPGINIEPKITDSVTGFFQFDSIPVGAVAVEVSAGGYLHEATSTLIKVNDVTKLEFNLKPALVKGMIIGQVTDRKDGKPLPASITFPQTELASIETDPATGIFKGEVPVGSYAVIVKSAGYIDQPAPLVVEEDKTVEKNFQLVKKGMVITLRGIYFDFDKTTIRPESYPVLDDAARILKDNPTIRVEIQGHTDSIGSDDYNLKLSDGRAASVVNYFISQHRIDPNRLISRGYGESKPIASNASDSGRQLNRRVEFVILGQMGE